MILKLFSLPFNWFIQGIITVVVFVVNVVKNIILFLITLIKYFFIGIYSVLEFLFMMLQKLLVIFKDFAITVGKGLVYISQKLGGVLIRIGQVIYRMVHYLFYGIYISVKMIVVYFYNAGKYLGISIYKILRFSIINFYYGLIVSFSFVFKGAYTFLKYIYQGFLKLINYIYKGLKQIFVAIIKFFKLIGKGIVVLFKFLAKIPAFIGSKIRWFGVLLFKIFIRPFIQLYASIKDFLDGLGDKFKNFNKSIINFPKKFKNGIINWFNSLNLVKDIKNRREMKRQALLIDFDAEGAERSDEKVTYRYVAKDSEGKIEKGKLSAYSKLDVHSYLLSEGYEVYEIDQYKGFNLHIGGHRRIKINKLAFVLTQLSTYLKAGIPLVDAIKILSKQSKNNYMIDVYRGVVYELTMGESFSEALAKQGNAFPKLLTNMIKSAELAGDLPETLDNMADYYNAVYKTRKQMLTAMMYPTVIFGFAVLIIAFILLYVIPDFVKIYKDMGSELPAITRITINASDYLANNLIYIIVVILVIIGGFITLYKNVKVFRLLMQWLLMHMPIIGKIIIYNEVTMFAKTFGSLLSHNVFITESMEILSKITNNEIYKMLIFDTITNLAKGESISVSFKNQWAFPLVAYEMLLTGERTGQPGPMMNKVADYYQEEHANAVNQIKVFIEPVMLIFLAVVVGMILLSVILPMFNLYGSLGMS